MIHHLWENEYGLGAVVDQYRDLPDEWPGATLKAICVRTLVSIEGAEIVHLKRALDAAEILLGKLTVPLLDALHNAADFDSQAIYDLLADTGIIRREPYDPEARKGDEFADSEPGEEVWVLTEAGKRFAGKVG